MISLFEGRGEERSVCIFGAHRLHTDSTQAAYKQHTGSTNEFSGAVCVDAIWTLNGVRTEEERRKSGGGAEEERRRSIGVASHFFPFFRTWGDARETQLGLNSDSTRTQLGLNSDSTRTQLKTNSEPIARNDILCFFPLEEYSILSVFCSSLMIETVLFLSARSALRGLNFFDKRKVCLRAFYRRNAFACKVKNGPNTCKNKKKCILLHFIYSCCFAFYNSVIIRKTDI